MVLDRQKMQDTHVWSLDSKPAHVAHNHKGSLDTLQQDMLGALEHDQRKKQVNDAKLRAVAQRVEYDDFERLVAGAHLKPVKPRSQVQKDIGQAFDGFVMPKAGPAAVPPPLPTVPSASAAPAAPKTSNEFVRVWRRQCKSTAEKLAYLVQIEPETLPILFKTELDAAIFDGIVSALHESVLAPAGEATAASAEPSAEAPPAEAHGCATDAAWAAGVLQNLARINRFELTLDFADASTSKSLVAIFDAFDADGSPAASALGAEPLAALRKKYGA